MNILEFDKNFLGALFEQAMGSPLRRHVCDLHTSPKDTGQRALCVAKTEHSHPLGMVVSTHFRCGKGVKRGLKNGALPFKID